jgi:phosphoenolpyruvate carboxylase
VNEIFWISFLTRCNLIAGFQVAGHKDLLEGDPYLKERLRIRDSYISALNVSQAYTLKRIRDPDFQVNTRPHLSKDIMESGKPAADLVKLNTTSEYAPGLEDTLILTMKGIAAGMQKNHRCVLPMCLAWRRTSS